MNSLLKKIYRFTGWPRNHHPKYQHTFSIDFPERINENTIYIIGEKRNPWFLVFECPCGWKELIQLNILKDANPRWKYKINWKSELFVSPSIWRAKGYRSHFLLKGSRIDWVKFDY